MSVIHYPDYDGLLNPIECALDFNDSNSSHHKTNDQEYIHH